MLDDTKDGIYMLNSTDGCYRDAAQFPPGDRPGRYWRGNDLCWSNLREVLERRDWPSMGRAMWWDWVAAVGSPIVKWMDLREKKQKDTRGCGDPKPKPTIFVSFL